MISLRSKFEFIPRGFKDTIVLIPGWATDYRIFAELDLNYNYLLPIKINNSNFDSKLKDALDYQSIDKVSLFGWSLGGFLAANFAAKNPARIYELILVSVRKKFEIESLDKIKNQIQINKKAYLHKFYLQCFCHDEKKEYLWFKDYLLKDYLAVLEAKDLIDGLDYLSQNSIEPQHLLSIKKIKIFHGLDDKIAPVEESREIKKCLCQTKGIYLEHRGHVPFLASSFKEEFYRE